jgi:tetratricopeptide (TPR) repeat protein
MIQRFTAGATLALVAAGLVIAQQQPAQQQPAQPGQAASSSPVAKQPQPKSQEEVQALQAIFQAQDPDSRLKAGEEFLNKFDNSEFKGLVLMVMAESYRQKNDHTNMVIFGERTLEADPNNYMAMLMLAQGLAQRTREFDLDREEKLGRAEKYAHQAMDILKTAPRPRPDITDEQWNTAKKDFEAQGHEALGLAAMARKKYDVAISEFKTAIEVTPTPDPATQVRLGAVYNQAGKYDEAIAVLDKVMAQPDAHPQIKQFAQAERARAFQLKNKGAAPATPAPGAQTQPAEPAPAPAPKPEP